MWALGLVAGGVTTIFEINVIVGHLLGNATRHVPFALLGSDVTDEALGRLEVVGHGARLIFARTVLEDRFALEFSCNCVWNTIGMHERTVERKLKAFGIKGDVGIGDLR